MTLSNAEDARTAAPEESARGLALLGIAVAIASYAVNAMDRTLFPLILPEVAKEYNFSLPEAGLMSTVFTIGMALAGLPTGFLMSRYSRKSVAQAGVFIFSAVTILTVVAGGFGDMLVYRALTGIGEAMQLTALLAIVSAARIADIALTDGTTRTSINAMYQVLPSRNRFAAQAAVEGIGVPGIPFEMASNRSRSDCRM